MIADGEWTVDEEGDLVPIGEAAHLFLFEHRNKIGQEQIYFPLWLREWEQEAGSNLEEN
jgi:hypothetical protein